MILFIPAALLLIIGWLIRFKKVTWLISGYNTSSKKKKEEYDPEKLCRYVGNFVFVLAGVLALTATARTLTGESETAALIGFIILGIVALAGIIWLNTGKRLNKQ